MTKAVITVSYNSSIYDASKIIIDKNTSCLVVVKDNKPIGMLTQSDIVKKIVQSRDINMKIFQAMSQPIISVHPNVSIAVALEIMHRKHIRHLAVIENNRLVGLVTQTDIVEASQLVMSDMRDKQETLKVLSEKDELTKLFNRRYFKFVFHRELEIVKRYGGLLSLAMFDIDHFKLVNDAYGHNAGDYILFKVAEIIRKNARDVDIVIRYGGEEFAVLFPGIGTRGARNIAERIREVIESSVFRFNNKNIKITISAGICKWTKGFNTMHDIIQETDKHLYIAKKTGRNKVSVSD